MATRQIHHQRRRYNMSDITVNSPIVSPVVIAKSSETTIVVDQSNTQSSTIEVTGIVSGKDAHFTYTQVTPSNTWDVTHNLNKKPSVTVVDSADSVVIGDVQYLNNNQVRLTFVGAFSGKAYFN